MPPLSLTHSLLLALLPAPAALAASTLFASHFEGTVYTLSLSDDASDLSVTSQASPGGMPSWLTLDREGRKLYVTDESWLGGTTLSTWAVGEGGVLTKEGVAPTPGGELHSCLFGGEDGKGFIAAAQYNNGGLITYELPLSSSSTPLDSFRYTMNGPGPVPSRQDQPHPHSTFTDPTGAFLLSADLGADLIRIFAITPSGALTECPPVSAPPGAGPRHGAFWGTSVLYIVNEISNSLTAWTVSYPDSSSSGCLSLSELQTTSTFPAGTAAPQGAKAAAVIVRDDFVYVTNRFDKSFGQASDSIALFDITGGDGAFEFVELADAAASFPRTMDFNAAGDMVAVGGQSSADVVILERDVTNGRLGGVLAKLQVGQMGREGQEDGLSAVIWNESGSVGEENEAS